MKNAKQILRWVQNEHECQEARYLTIREFEAKVKARSACEILIKLEDFIQQKTENREDEE